GVRSASAPIVAASQRNAPSPSFCALAISSTLPVGVLFAVLEETTAWCVVSDVVASAESFFWLCVLSLLLVVAVAAVSTAAVWFFTVVSIFDDSLFAVSGLT